MIDGRSEGFDLDGSESWAEWSQELALNLAMAGTAFGLAWFSVVQIWACMS